MDIVPTLETEQVAAYHRDGFVVVRQLFSRELTQALGREADELAARTDLIDASNLRCRFQPCGESGESRFETFDPVIDIGPVCHQIATSEALLGLLERLYGEPACLFKDKLIFKQPGQQGYVLHQDWIAWPGFPRSFLTVLVPIDAATEGNGCTEVFPGYHTQGSLAPEDGAFHPLTEEQVDLSTGVKLLLEPGDVAVFDGFTPHRSAPNRSGGWRRQLYLSYNATSDGGDQRADHYSQFRDFMAKRCEQEERSCYFK